MTTLPVFDSTGTQTRELEVAERLFGEAPKVAVLHQAILAELAARRQGNAHTKTRGEVAGSGHKLWRQKGTGRARVGDRRPPHRVGGGRATGPRSRSYRQRTAKGLKDAALRSALSARAAAGDVILMEPFELAEAKTRALAEVLASVGGGSGALLVLAQANEVIFRCGRNLPGLRIAEAGGVTAYEVMSARKVIIIADGLPRLEARLP
jgi:large subunit ribosomal protein L4